MNLCILKGKIVEDVTFDFMYNSKKVSIAKTKIKLDNGSIITIKGFDDMADWMYRNMSNNSEAILYGKLDNKLEIEIKGIKIFNSNMYNSV